MYFIPILSITIPQPLKTIAKTYGNHLILDGIHAIGHNIVAQAGIFFNVEEHCPGEGKLAFIVQSIPKIKLPVRFEANFPNFTNKKFLNCVEFGGPAAALLACYIQLKLANIYSEYSSNKSLMQNIKNGLSKPFYKGHSTSTLTIVGLHALKNTWEVIPGNHTSLERD